MNTATRNEAGSRSRGWRAIPGTVWALGFVSLLMDMSSEAIHSLVPVFLVSVLGANAATVGLIEGVAEATASPGCGILLVAFSNERIASIRGKLED